MFGLVIPIAFERAELFKVFDGKVVERLTCDGGADQKAQEQRDRRN